MAWVANLRAGSSVHVVVDRVRRPMTAVELSGEARAEAWDEVGRVWPRIAGYEQRAGRVLPVFLLESDTTA